LKKRFYSHPGLTEAGQKIYNDKKKQLQ
jgi:hypothetical protein